jgi:hypothetical protein
MKEQKLTKQDIPIVSSLGESELLQQAGWKRSGIFSWCVDYDQPKKPYIGMTKEQSKEDILAPAPTATELFAALPADYEGLYIRVNKWDKSSGAKKAGYSVSYCTEDGSAQFVSDAATLEGALANMWVWMHSEDPPHYEPDEE